MCSAKLAGLSGLMLTGGIASVVSSQGQNIYVFAAAADGGISLNGGQGRIVGALTGSCASRLVAECADSVAGRRIAAAHGRG